MTNKVKNEEFEVYFRKQFLKETGNDLEEYNVFSEEDKNALRTRRFMECVCICENGDLKPLCDDERSLMYTMYKMKLVILRFFYMPINDEKTDI